MAKLKINLQDLAFAFLNDDPEIDPHLNLETGELVDNSSTYYGSSVTKYSSKSSVITDEDGESVEEAAPAELDEESPDEDDDDDDKFDEIADFDKFVKVKPLSPKGHLNIIEEFLQSHDLKQHKEFATLRYINDLEYKVKEHKEVFNKWQNFKQQKMRFIAGKWLEINKIKADLI